MQFIHQPLTWGFLLVLVPLAIHLINMMRHRRVPWAAMEFLLVSYKKHKRWVWLKQLLLLLLRMLAIAAVVAMLAQLVTTDQWSSLFGRQTTHHIVLLDDSLSMSDRAGGTSAFDRARRAIGQIIAQAESDNTDQKLTLIRYSQAIRVGAAQDESAAATNLADLNAEPISKTIQSEFEDTSATFDATELAVGIDKALELAEQLVDQSPRDQSVLHLLSDFRQGDWRDPVSLRDTLGRIFKQGTDIRLIRCASSQSPNLAITQIEPAEGTQAAGVPLFMIVKVRNFGTTAAEQVAIKIQSTFHPTFSNGTPSNRQSSDLPDLLIERIPAGETVTTQFQVFFPTVGQHVVQASLPPDAVASDNERWCVVDLAIGESVLVVDGNPNDRAAYYLESVFQPGTKAKTGVMPERQPLSYLRDAAPDELARHRVVYLLNPPALDQRTQDNLQQYVDAGGGLAVFLGEETNTSFFSNWYADGNGLFPVPLQRLENRERSTDDEGPDVRFEDHPIFQTLMGDRNPFASSIRIRRAAMPPDGWRAPADSTIQTLARLSNRQPLVVERQWGAGRVVAFLTSLDPTWNNWALEPSFIVVVLQLHAYLSDQQRPTNQRLVGSVLHVQIDSTRYRPELLFRAPVASSQAPVEIEMHADPVAAADSPLLAASLGIDQQSGAPTGQTDSSGVYEAVLTMLDGTSDRRRYALNVNTVESDLTLQEPAELRRRLEPIKVAVTDADQLIYESTQLSGYSWSELLLWSLLIALLLEQLLAFSASYHTRPLVRPGGAR